MIFINSIELLELGNSDVLKIDNTVIKKSKRKVQTDIDLSDDGMFDYHGLKITKSDCERAIDELENADKKEYYYFLANNKPLNNYLVNGDEKFFSTFVHEGIYKLPDFIKFISPYFSQRFDKSLLIAFKSDDTIKFHSILRTQSLFDQSEINIAFSGISKEIQNRILQIQEITEYIKRNKSEYTETTVVEMVDVVQKKFHTEIINSLPTSYFQSQINKIAASINYLQIAIEEEYGATIVSLDLIEFALKMNVESVSKPTFLNNREILKKRQADKEEEEKNAPIFGTWGTILMQINEVSVEVEEGTLTSLLASNKAISLFSVSELNSLPIFANEIRNQIGYAIRGLSISSWNKQEDIISALKLIKIALQINVSADVKETLIQDETELFKLQEKYKGIITCYFCDKQKVEERSKLTKTIYKENSRSYFPRRSVQYSYADIEIPRCGSCAKIHSAGNDNYLFVLFAGLILGGIIGAFIDEHFIVGGLIGAFVGWIIGKILESNLASKNGIKDISNSTLRNHPKLLERIQNGWTFSKPTA